jgi:hypothetical protein
MSGSTSIGLSRPNSAASAAAKALLNTATKPTPPRPQSPVVEAKTSGAYNVSAIVSKGEESKGEINHYQSSNNTSSLSLGQTAMNYLKVILEQLKLKSKSQDPQKEYIATLNLAFSNNRWQNLRGQDQRELNKIPAILKTVTGNNTAVNLQINTLFEQYGLVKINDQTPIIPPAPTTTQRSESSSDSSGDEKTPPNTPATTKQSSSALPQFTTADILLAKILSNGTLNSLSTTYEICFGPVEFMKKSADKMEALAETMESFSKTKSESNAIKLATLHSEMFYIYRKFFSNYNYSNKLNSDDKTYISNGIKELKDHLIKVETFLRVAANILPIDYKNTLTEELNEFKHTVNEINARVFQHPPVYRNLPPLVD